MRQTVEHSFNLIPFPGSKIPEINITGKITRDQNALTIEYVLTGDIDPISFPRVTAHPTRQEELWLDSCFEFFLAIPGQPQYWEFNLSPSRDWNVFRMDAYRRIGFRQENLIQTPTLHIRKDRESFRLAAVVDLKPIIPSEMEIQSGITSVIRTQDGNESYWALTHPQSEADFHLRESFILPL